MTAPRPIPLAKLRLGDGAGTDEILAALAKVAEAGDIAAFMLGQTRCILVNGVALVRTLFTRHEPDLVKPEFVKDSNRGHWGDGLTTLERPFWRSRRQMLLPSFRANKVAARLALVPELTADMLATWAPGATIDLTRTLRILTARIAARLVLDADLEGWGSGEGRAGVIAMPQAYGEDYASTPGGDETEPLVMIRPRAPKNMDDVCRIVDVRIASGERRGDVLSDLVATRQGDGKHLVRQDILNEVIQMLYAGHLTVPTTLVRFWQDVTVGAHQAALCREADTLPTLPGVSILTRSKTLAMLRESMRLHPTAPILYREVARPFVLCGHRFDQGDAVWVSPYLLQRDPRIYRDACVFQPERFLGKPADADVRAAFIPFGAGPRTCIAAQQSLLQMSLIALCIARRFTLASEPGRLGQFTVTPR